MPLQQEAMTYNLASDTLRGLKWSYGATLANALVQLALTAIFARLLAPIDFGLLAISLVVVRFGSYFAEMGVGAALVQKQEITDEDINAGYTATLLLGFGIATVVIVLAPILAELLSNSQVVNVIRAMAVSLFITTVSVPATSLLRRKLDFRALGLSELIAYATGGIIGVGLASTGYGVWSLVASVIVQNIVLGFIAYQLSGRPLSLSFDARRLRGLLSYGGRFSLISFFEFLSYNIDTFLIGSFLGAGSAGTYNRASVLATVPAQYLNRSLMRVLFPSFSRLQTDLARMKEAYLSGLLFLGIGLFSICFGISAASEEIVKVALGEQWTEVIPILTVLALAIPAHLLLHFSGMISETTGQLTTKLLVRILHFSTLLLAYLCFYGYGLIAFVWVLLATETVFYLIYTHIAVRILNMQWLNLLNVHMYVVASGVVVFVPVYVVGSVLRLHVVSPFIVLICEVLMACISLGLYLVGRPPKYIRSEIARRFIDNSNLLSQSSFFKSFALWYTSFLQSK
jgi:lipopolysaccharide exporter